MDLLQIILGFLGGGGLAWYIALRKLPGESRKLDADTTGVLSKAFVDLLNAIQVERAAFSVERDSLIKRIDTMEAEQETHRIARNAEIDELKVKIQSDLMETRNLRADYADAQKRIIKLEDMVVKMSNYIDTMKQAMQKANLDVPLNGELLESAKRLRLSIEQREQLKGGK